MISFLCIFSLTLVFLVSCSHRKIFIRHSKYFRFNLIIFSHLKCLQAFVKLSAKRPRVDPENTDYYYCAMNFSHKCIFFAFFMILADHVLAEHAMGKSGKSTDSLTLKSSKSSKSRRNIRRLSYKSSKSTKSTLGKSSKSRRTWRIRASAAAGVAAALWNRGKCMNILCV